MAGQYAFERVPLCTSFKSASINLPTNCMFVVRPSDGLRPATYAKELYYQGEQSSSADEGGVATNFAAGERAPGERLGETSAERNPIVFGHLSQPLRAGLTSAAPTALGDEEGGLTELQVHDKRRKEGPLVHGGSVANLIACSRLIQF